MRVRKRTIEEGAAERLRLLLHLYQEGISLSRDDMDALRNADLIKDEHTKEAGKDPDLPKIAIPTPQTIQADEHVYIVQEQEMMKRQITGWNKTVIAARAYAQFGVFKNTFTHKKIVKDDWCPKSILPHSKEFVEWINILSSPDGFFRQPFYEPFHLYCKQAEQWLEESKENFGDDVRTYRMRELARERENTYYALDKYGYIKEESSDGISDYRAAYAHKVILYLLDCRYSLDIAKARQVAFTTTICLWAMFRCSLNVNVQIKYISENEEKAKATARDKVKYPYAKLPKWQRAKINNDSERLFYWGKRVDKGIIEGQNSLFEILSPSETAVASSTPTVTFIDEEGNIGNLNSLLSDIEPTLLGLNPKTGKQETLRQVVSWGTGGNISTLGAAFMSRHMSLREQWKTSPYNMPVIPVLFNVWYRPGWTKELQEEERLKAYSIQGPESERKRIRFHQSFPETIEDVFMAGGDRLVSSEMIKREKEKTSQAERAMRYGFFVPIYDTQKPAPEGSDVPFEIIGADFVQTTREDPRVTACIFVDNSEKWRWRFFKGDDPIASNSGTSKFASAIWDSLWKTVACILNMRTGDYRESFLQSMLMQMYYEDPNLDIRCPELLEGNIGAAYREYMDGKNRSKVFVHESELPETLQTAGLTVGIGLDKKGFRAKVLISKLTELVTTFGKNIYHLVFWTQLETYVPKWTGRSEVWEPMDKRFHNDDVLDAVVYSYICAEVYIGKTPVLVKAEGYVSKKQKKKQYEKLVRNPDGTLSRIHA